MRRRLSDAWWSIPDDVLNFVVFGGLLVLVAQILKHTG